jgi:hypothetical protein
MVSVLNEMTHRCPQRLKVQFLMQVGRQQNAINAIMIRLLDE